MQLVVSWQGTLPALHSRGMPHFPCQALLVVALLYLGRFDATFALLRAKGVSRLHCMCECCVPRDLLCLLGLLCSARCMALVCPWTSLHAQERLRQHVCLTAAALLRRCWAPGLFPTWCRAWASHR